jgi:uncharacterized protein YutE (UPF0331/DUF86 family)
MIDQQKTIASLGELIEQAERLVPGRTFLSPESAGECQYWFSHIVALMDRITPQSSFYNQEARHLIHRSNRQGGIYLEDIRRLVGHLIFVRDAVNDGLLVRIEYEITASDFSDFLDHARSYFDALQKVQSAIIASAVFEDTVRRIGSKEGIIKQEQLEAVINALKTSGVITKTEAKKLKYYAGIRNSALHAAWDEFDLPDVGDLITGTQQLIDQHLTGP